jgi:hypothetical protein
MVEAGQATDDIMAHALCMLDNEGHRNKLRIRNIYRLSTATVLTRTHFSVTLYVLCHTCLLVVLKLRMT